MFGLKGGAVQVPRWILIFRAMQLFLAVIAIDTTAYPLSIDGGGPIQPPFIATILIAILTIAPILVFTTPLHIAQRKVYDPRLALLLDGFAALYWLAAFTTLASYLDVYSFYGWDSRVNRSPSNKCLKCRRTWRTSVTATVFAAIEFILFTFTSLIFIYYYHCHMAGMDAAGIASPRKTEAAVGTTSTIAMGTNEVAGAKAETKEPNTQSGPAERPTNNTGADAPRSSVTAPMSRPPYPESPTIPADHGENYGHKN